MGILQSKHSKDILEHWLWAVPVLLIVAALAVRQIDLYSPTADEFFSMNNAGWLRTGPYSPTDILQSLQQNSPNHTPGYFMLLSAWGRLTIYDVALGRVLTIFTGLLALAVTYRLARDFAAPVAGLFAVIITASSAFYNFYYAHVRMYPLLVLTSGIVLWLYLRITHQQKRAKRRDYLALGAAVFALVNTHAFSAVFLLTLGIYHLFIAPKNRRWLWVSLAVAAAVLLFSPWIWVLITGGIDQTIRYWGTAAVNGQTTVRVWLTVMLNNQPLLMLLPIVGLAAGIWTKTIRFKLYLILFPAFLIILALIAHFTNLIIASSMRYHLAGWLPLTLFIVSGLYALYCFRKWLGLLVLLWVIAGLAFQTPAGLQHYGRIYNFSHPPVQVISRLALQAESNPIIIGYQYRYRILNWRAYIDYSQRDHYFEQHDITLEVINDLSGFEEYTSQYVITGPSIWIFYQTSKADPTEAAQIEAVMHKLNYQLCETVEVGIDTIVTQYLWDTLNCQAPQPAASYQTDIIDYQFYAAELDAAHSKLLFSDQWTAPGDDRLENYKMSYQLITSDWDNVAQLDLPLVHEGQLRLFSIDIADVPAGAYRLMAILYHKDSGERQDWLNSAQDASNMLTLTEIVIP